MTAISVYADALKQSAAVVARKMGVNFAGASKETRVIVRVTLGVFATLIKLLVDKGVFTDAEVQAAFDATAGSAYTDEPVMTPEPPP
jgi:hypothetical protein